MCKPYFDRIKYLTVKNKNNEAMKTPTPKAKKNSTDDGVFPINEKFPLVEVSEGELLEVLVAVSVVVELISGYVFEILYQDYIESDKFSI